MKKNPKVIATPADLAARRAAVVPPTKDAIYMCAGGGCIASGAMKLKAALLGELKTHKLDTKVAIVETGCMGPCARGPILLMGRDNVYYQHVAESDAAEIVEKHVLKGEAIHRLVWKEGPAQKPIPVQSDIPFFKRQTKIVLRNCGQIDPNSIDDFIRHSGYQALARCSPP